MRRTASGVSIVLQHQHNGPSATNPGLITGTQQITQGQMDRCVDVATMNSFCSDAEVNIVCWPRQRLEHRVRPERKVVGGTMVRGPS